MITYFIILLSRLFFPFTVTFFQLATFAWVFGKYVLFLFSTIKLNFRRTLSAIFTFILFATPLSLTYLSFSPFVLFQTSSPLICSYGWYITGLISTFKKQCSQEKHQGWQPEKPRKLPITVVWGMQGWHSMLSQAERENPAEGHLRKALFVCSSGKATKTWKRASCTEYISSIQRGEETFFCVECVERNNTGYPQKHPPSYKETIQEMGMQCLQFHFWLFVKRS